MKSVKKNLFTETMKLLTKHAYEIRYVPHEVIEDYNATYNVVCEISTLQLMQQKS
ncbi:MAG: hypothetical protein WAN82_07890 [Candidatus Bathyarchaeia archaeon]